MAPTAQPKPYQMASTYEVGDFYIQFPSANSNTASEAFPTSRYPATKFGGTWTAIWNSQGLFFKTQGDPLTQTNGENNARTNGLQTDAGQDHRHQVGWYYGISPGGAGNTQLNAGGATMNWYSAGPLEYNSCDTPRTGKETRPRNRLWIIWKRTA